MKTKEFSPRKAVLMKVDPLNTSVSTFTFKMDAFKDGNFKAGQFVTFEFPISEKRIERLRSYSIASAPNPYSDQLQFCIEKLKHGRATNFLFHEMNIEGSLLYRGPHGGFHLKGEASGRMVFICTGTGVAPFRSIILDLINKNQFNNPVHLIFGCRYESGILYRQEFENLQHSYPNFTYDICLSMPAGTTAKRYVHEVYLDQYDNDIVDTTFFLCGWTRMINEARDNLRTKLGVQKERIKFESYGNY